MNESRALALFAGAEEEAAREAWSWLWEQNRRSLSRYLGQWLYPQECEDVVQETFLKVWDYRPRFRNQGTAAWQGFLHLTARRCSIDTLRRRLPVTEESEWQQDSGPRDPVSEDIADRVLAALDNDALWLSADILWLGLDPALSRKTHYRQLLAAQLYYIDGDSWEDVLESLPCGPTGEPPLVRETLDAWLSSPGVLSFLAYNTLYYSRNRLAAFLLGLPDQCSSDDLNALMRQAVKANSLPPDGWTWGEVRVILWRYRHDLSAEDILKRRDCLLSREELQALLDRLTALLPFQYQMECLLAYLAPAPWLDAPAVLRKPGLWQRLAFQYRYHDDLPHRDIRERLGPASAKVGYEVTAGMLNVWLSNGRLLTRLARAVSGGKGSESDD